MATPPDSCIESRSFRNTTENSASNTRPNPSTGWTIDTGAFATALSNRSQPKVLIMIPTTQTRERKNARKTLP